jgi:hypothetical protein
MGQMTEAEVGISVSLNINFDNIKLISSLLELSNLRIYISGISEEHDEILDYENDHIEELDTDIIDELCAQDTQQEFNKKYEEFNIKKKLAFHFIYVVSKIYACNLSYRSIPRLFSHDENITTSIELINKIHNGVNLFKSINVPDNLIKIGNTINHA